MPETQGTTKRGAETDEMPLESASPATHEEVEAVLMAEQMKESAAAEPNVGGGEGPMAQAVEPTRPVTPAKPTVAGTQTNAKNPDLEPSTPNGKEGP